MQEVSGTVFVGEANSLSGAFLRRQCGPLFVRVGLMLGPCAVGITMAYLLRDQIPMHYDDAFYDWSPLAGWFLGAVAGILLSQVYLTHRAKRSYAAISGSPGPVPCWFAFKPDKLSYRDTSAQIEYNWPAIHEVFLHGKYWGINATPCPLVFPRRFFADLTAEKAFIAEMLSFMTPEAQAKSKSAQKWLSSAG